ncbi:MAG: UTP--glucose-1-phosphate uridylyltransferase [Spirochaetia bacterium]|nr:UTP--glucose-1-phosphate uridylyltransferase [Spirochaetia bacterium]
MEDFNKVRTEIEHRMKEHKIHEDVIHSFISSTKKVHEGFSGKISFDKIREPDLNDLIFYKELKKNSLLQKNLNRLVVIKLNGGLGSSMGLSKAKSIIPVKNGLNFLQITINQLLILRQRAKINIPIIFMNSFSTRDDTLATEELRGINREHNLPEDFLQNKVPRLNAETLMPVGDGESPGNWCPPGHGDIYLALKNSGILDQLIESGKDIAFVSNTDNLGASVTSRILSEFIKHDLEFAMEVTAKTPSDIKGGIPVKHGKRIELLEIAQVKEENVKDFQDMDRFSYFNTNNLWIHLPSLKKRMESDFELPLIVNPKEVVGQKIIQLETAMGAAIGLFEKTRAFVVPRSRFAPVKACSDLLVRRSDAYILQEKSGLLRINPEREFGEVHANLDGNYKNLEDFDRYFQQIPSLLYADHFNVKGPVHFDISVKITGDVTIENPTDRIRNISELGRTEFSNETVSFA